MLLDGYRRLLEDIEKRRYGRMCEGMNWIAQRVQSNLEEAQQWKDGVDGILGHVYGILGESVPDTGKIVESAKRKYEQNKDVVVAMEKYSYIDTLLEVVPYGEEVPKDFLETLIPLDTYASGHEDTIWYRQWHLSAAMPYFLFWLNQEPKYWTPQFMDSRFKLIMSIKGETAEFYNICREQWGICLYEFFKKNADVGAEENAKACYNRAYEVWKEYQEQTGTKKYINTEIPPEVSFETEYALCKYRRRANAMYIEWILEAVERDLDTVSSPMIDKLRRNRVQQIFSIALREGLDLAGYEDRLYWVTRRIGLNSNELYEQLRQSLAKKKEEQSRQQLLVAQEAEKAEAARLSKLSHSQMCMDFLEQRKHLPCMPEGFADLALEAYVTELHTYLVEETGKVFRLMPTMTIEERIKSLAEYTRIYAETHISELKSLREKYIRKTFREEYESKMTQFCREWGTFDEPGGGYAADWEIAPILEYAFSRDVKHRLEEECVKKLYYDGPTREQMEAVHEEAEMEIMHKNAKKRAKGAKNIKTAKNIPGLSFVSKFRK